MAAEDPTNWAKQAVNRLKEWIGGIEERRVNHEWRKTKLSRTCGFRAKTCRAMDQGSFATNCTP